MMGQRLLQCGRSRIFGAWRQAEAPSLTLRIHYWRLVRQARSALVGGPLSDEDRNIWPWYASTALVGVYDAGLLVFLPVFLARLEATPTLIGLYNSLPALFSMVLLLSLIHI